MQTVAPSPPAHTSCVSAWLDNMTPDAFKEDVERALVSFEGLPIETITLLAHNNLEQCPRSAYAFAAYALAGWSPVGVAARLAALYPDDGAAQVAGQAALKVAESLGHNPVSFKESMAAFRGSHHATVAHIAERLQARISAEMKLGHVRSRVVSARSRRRGTQHSARSGVTSSTSDDGPGSSDPPGEPPSAPAASRLTRSTSPRSTRPAAASLCLAATNVALGPLPAVPSDETGPPAPSASTSRDCLVNSTEAPSGSPETQMPAVTTLPSQSITEDAKYIILARSKKCAVCRRNGATTVNLIVPGGYGGTPRVDNLQPVHEKCGQLRHKIEGTSAEPPQEYAEDLARLLAIPHVGDEVREILHFAATVKGTCRKPGSYNSLDACHTIKGLLRGSIGWDFLGWMQRPEGITPEDEDWIKTSSAYEAAFFSAYGLLPSDGI